jgi:hypothetical protein
VNDRIRKAGEFVRDAVVESAQQRASDRDLEMQVRGFKGAAAITLRLIEDKIDTFTERMKGPGLNKSEQAAYAALLDLRSEIEADCDRYWRDYAVDWRPLKRVVKGKVTLRPRDEQS